MLSLLEVLQGPIEVTKQNLESAISLSCPTYYAGRQVIVKNKDTGLYGLFKDVVGVVMIASTAVLEPMRIVWNLGMACMGFLSLVVSVILVIPMTLIFRIIKAF